MTDVFISYKREDHSTAKAIAGVLASHGYEVWWDIELLPGDRFAQEIRQIIARARSAIVLWSRQAVESPYVLDEAALARDRGILLPVRLDDCELPLGFGGLHTHDLSEWDGGIDSALLEPLLKAVENRAGARDKRSARVAATATVDSELIAEATLWKSIREREPQSIRSYQEYLERYGEGASFAEIARLRMGELGGAAPSASQSRGMKVGVVALVVGVLGVGSWLGLRNERPPQPMLRPSDRIEAPAVAPAPAPARTEVQDEPPQPTLEPRANGVAAVSSGDVPSSLRDAEISVRFDEPSRARAEAILELLSGIGIEHRSVAVYSIPGTVANRIYHPPGLLEAARWLRRELEGRVRLELVAYQPKGTSQASQIRIVVGATEN